ncbi:MAG: DNA gyrase C-terminal beta-propeller domain-containing protein, partial [Gammaproteobacteria bacterium]
VGAAQVFAGDELMLISNMGTLVRTASDEISVQGRNTQGVRLIMLRGDEKLVGVARIDESAGNGDAVDEAENDAPEPDPTEPGEP